MPKRDSKVPGVHFKVDNVYGALDVIHTLSDSEAFSVYMLGDNRKERMDNLKAAIATVETNLFFLGVDWIALVETLRANRSFMAQLEKWCCISGLQGAGIYTPATDVDEERHVKSLKRQKWQESQRKRDVAKANALAEANRIAAIGPVYNTEPLPRVPGLRFKYVDTTEGYITYEKVKRLALVHEPSNKYLLEWTVSHADESLWPEILIFVVKVFSAFDWGLDEATLVSQWEAEEKAGKNRLKSANSEVESFIRGLNREKTEREKAEKQAKEDASS